ncbi:MAG: hypothetical protein CVV49_05595 [Spirochaetae bacterium HGW-Spirochaetae-5]|nr:MAG: hypothetical protein CVV49_05595 [Spirochaetae bacterium HGW-Spirochaetae-5]
MFTSSTVSVYYIKINNIIIIPAPAAGGNLFLKAQRYALCPGMGDTGGPPFPTSAKQTRFRKQFAAFRCSGDNNVLFTYKYLKIKTGKNMKFN